MEYEGLSAAFRGPGDKGDNVKVQLQTHIPRTIEIPPQFLVPIKPIHEANVRKAIIIFGVNVGSEVELKDTELGGEWTVWNLETSSFSLVSSANLAAFPPDSETGSIEKPPGEVTRLSRTGYTLLEVVPWDSSTYTEVQVCFVPISIVLHSDFNCRNTSVI